MTDIEKLRELAEKANQWGEWAIWEDLHDGGFVHVGNADGVIPEGAIATGDDVEVNPIAQCFTREIAEHVAAFDPSTVLALLDRLQAAERERDEAREQAAEDRAEWVELKKRASQRFNACQQKKRELRRMEVRAEAAEVKIAAVREIIAPFWVSGRDIPRYVGAASDARLNAIEAALQESEGE